MVEKFCSSLHTESIVDACVHALLGDKKFVCQIAEWIEKINEALPELNDAISNLKRPTPKDIQWAEEEKSKVVECGVSLQASVGHTVSSVRTSKSPLE